MKIETKAKAKGWDEPRRKPNALQYADVDGEFMIMMALSLLATVFIPMVIL